MEVLVELDPLEAGLLRGCLWEGTEAVPYPRADPSDQVRLPGDTWAAASIPAGVHLEWEGEVDAIEIGYTTATDELGYRGSGAGTSFSLWLDDLCLGDVTASLGRGVASFAVAKLLETTGAATRESVTGASRGRFRCYLPEGMKPRVHALRASGGVVSAPAPVPEVIVYGDSVAEGWSASAPPLSWPTRLERSLGVEVHNLGYAGAARGEIVSAEQIASISDRPIAAIVLAYGTNCWTRVPHSTRMLEANLNAFLDVLRQAHGAVPVVLTSPIVRPDAEEVPNRLGATLRDLREAMEQVVWERMESDSLLRLVRGSPLVEPADLVDGIHPGDKGHASIARAVGEELRRALEARP